MDGGEHAPGSMCSPHLFSTLPFTLPNPHELYAYK